MHYIADASYISEHKIKVIFENDEQKIVDLSSHLSGPIFQPLQDLNYFKSFYVNHDIDTVVWPNDADFSPDFLYKIGENISEQSDADYCR